MILIGVVFTGDPRMQQVFRGNYGKAVRRGGDAELIGAAGLNPHAEAAVHLLHAHHLLEDDRALIGEILLVDALGQDFIRRQHAEVEVTERHAAVADRDGIPAVFVPPGEEKRRAAELTPQNEAVELCRKVPLVLRLREQARGNQALFIVRDLAGRGVDLH